MAEDVIADVAGQFMMTIGIAGVVYIVLSLLLFGWICSWFKIEGFWKNVGVGFVSMLASWIVNLVFGFIPVQGAMTLVIGLISLCLGIFAAIAVMKYMLAIEWGKSVGLFFTWFGLNIVLGIIFAIIILVALGAQFFGFLMELMGSSATAPV